MVKFRSFEDANVELIRKDRAYAKALLEEAASVFLNGEAAVARVVLRDLVNGSIGFEAVGKAMGKNAKSVHRMLSSAGNPTMDNLSAIFGVLATALAVDLKVSTTRAA